MVAFDNLRLTGFKSFIEATDMPIRPGLTGIVGPNGCGKSNLVEALRWVMGESSAKRLRGGEMDDVIFAGAAGRPARNQAEVSVRLANPDFDTPLQFNDDQIIEVTRKVVRGQGSAYRVNGRDHRAQDLKLLFADLASGASSNAMVAQGRVSAIVNARPTDRRALLEEAAGITGLYSRRREAENRLRAAETNLERVADLRQSKESQQRTLERQAKAARRYSDLQAKARALAAGLAYQEWLGLEAALAEANGALSRCYARCEELSLAEAVAQREESEASAALEPTRLAHGEAAARLQRLDLALEALATEERGLEAKKADLTRQLAEVGDDLTREQDNVTAAQERLEALATEETTLKDRRQALKPQVAAAEAALGTFEGEERKASEALREASLRLSTARNERLALSSRIDALHNRQQGLDQKLKTLSNDASFDGKDEGAIERMLADQATQTHMLTQLQETRADLALARDQATQDVEAAQADLAAARQAEQQLDGEVSGLRAFLAKDQKGDQGKSKESDTIGETLAQMLILDPAYTKAAAAVLGQGIEAPLVDADTGDMAEDMAHWRSWPHAPAAPALPDGLPNLGAKVQSPPWMQTILAHVGIAENADQARRLQQDLQPGQALTTRDGGLWRWDGFVADQGDDARASASAALIERNQRLSQLDGQRPALVQRVEAGETKAAQAQAALETAQAALRARDQDLDERRRARDASGVAITQAQQALAQHRTKMAAQEAERVGTMREQETVTAELTGLEGTLTAQGDLADLEAAVTQAQATLATQSDHVRNEREGVETQKRDLISLDARLGAIVTETFTFEGQLRNAERQFEVLANRGKALEAESQTQSHRPQEIADKRFDLQESKQSAERARANAGDALAAAETLLRQHRAAYAAAQKDYGQAREERACLTAEQSAAQDRLTHSAQAAFDAFRVPAADLLPLSGVAEADDLPTKQEATEKLARIERQIDTIGPVNLAAEQEMESLRDELDRIHNETAELTQAIAKLRRVIGELNQEGRARLTAAFDQVATHFSTLFQRLFGGGKARLELIGSSDPLEAGLEIIASPPGKRLQSLTLLSGGEQTLTALALIFAMFRANPAPLCVLDEVDAPLDDANVERMCGLLGDMAAEVGTRFLIVTHNALTMARVDRLFGVTMAERGVSRLVSVDLEAAVQFQGD